MSRLRAWAAARRRVGLTSARVTRADLSSSLTRKNVPQERVLTTARLRPLALIFGLLALSSSPAMVLAQEARSDDPAEERRLLEEAREAQDEAINAQPGLNVPQSDVFGNREDETCFEISGIVVEGVTLFKKGRLQAIIDANSSACMGQVAIGRLAEAIQNLYTEAGYITSQVFIPGQDLSKGTLTLVVVEGVVESMPTNGQADRPAYVRWAFPIAPDDELNLRDIERGVDNMNRLQSQNADVQLVAGQEVGGSTVAITVTYDEDAKYRHRVGTRVSGTEGNIGGLSLDYGLTAENLMGLNDIWNFSYFGGIGSNGLSASVDVPIGYWDNNGSLTYSEYLQTPNPSTEIFGQSISFSWSSKKQVFRNQKRMISVGGTVRGSYEERFVNGAPLSPNISLTYDIGYNETYVGDYGNWTFNAGLNGGIPALGAPEDPDNLCPGGPEGCTQVSYEMPVITAGFTRVRPLGQYTTYVTSVRGQVAYMPTAYTWNIGGWGSVRGFDGSAPSGDNGLLWQNEWTIRDPFRAQPRGCYKDVHQGPDHEPGKEYIREETDDCVYRRDGGSATAEVLNDELEADQSIRGGVKELSRTEGGSRANPESSNGAQEVVNQEGQPARTAQQIVKEEVAKLNGLVDQAEAIKEADKAALREQGLLSFEDLAQDMKTLTEGLQATIKGETGRIVDFRDFLRAVGQAEGAEYGELRNVAFGVVREELEALREAIAGAFGQTREEFFTENDTGPDRELPWWSRLTLTYTLDVGVTHSWFTGETDTLVGGSIGMSYAGDGYVTTVKAGHGIYSTVDGIGDDWAFSVDLSRSF